MKPERELTRTKFNQSIKAFKRNHGVKLKDILNKKNNPEVIKAFLADPIIHDYLARPLMDFTDGHPQLFDSKNFYLCH